MNIFNIYLKEIISLIKKNQKNLSLEKTNNFKGINLEVPPSKFDSDL